MRGNGHKHIFGGNNYYILTCLQDYLGKLLNVNILAQKYSNEYLNIPSCKLDLRLFIPSGIYKNCQSISCDFVKNQKQTFLQYYFKLCYFLFPPFQTPKQIIPYVVFSCDSYAYSYNYIILFLYFLIISN